MKKSVITVLAATALAGAAAWYVKRRQKTSRPQAMATDLGNNSRHLNPVFSKLKATAG